MEPTRRLGMAVTNPNRTPLRYLAFAWCAAISVLALLVAAPGSSVAQIGSQTGYQEWVPDRDTDAPTGRGRDAVGWGGAAAPSDGSGSGLPGAAGEGTAGRTGDVATSERRAGSPYSPAGVKASAARGVAGADQGSQAQRQRSAAGTIPLTRDNMLLAFAVAAAAIGAGFGVNRLARRTTGT
jgi:hypothetical protein